MSHQSGNYNVHILCLSISLHFVLHDSGSFHHVACEYHQGDFSADGVAGAQRLGSVESC